MKTAQEPNRDEGGREGEGSEYRQDNTMAIWKVHDERSFVYRDARMLGVYYDAMLLVGTRLMPGSSDRCGALFDRPRACCDTLMYARPISSGSSRPGGADGTEAVTMLTASGPPGPSDSPISYSSTQLRSAMKREVLMN